MVRKLDRYARRRMESEFQTRQRQALHIEGERLSALLLEVAVRRLKAAYDAAQADAPVLQKYGLCTQVEVVNFRVYHSETGRWDDGVCTKVDLPGYMIPGSHTAYVSLYLGGHAAGVAEISNRPYSAHDDHDSPDWRLAREIIQLRNTYRADQDAAFKAFAAEIRATSSWKVLAKVHPWIDDIFAVSAPVED